MIESLIKEFKFSHSNSQKLRTYVYEITRRENVTEETILQNLHLENIRNESALQGKQKSEKIIQLLFERRFPETTKLIKAGVWQL